MVHFILSYVLKLVLCIFPCEPIYVLELQYKDMLLVNVWVWQDILVKRSYFVLDMILELSRNKESYANMILRKLPIKKYLDIWVHEIWLLAIYPYSLPYYHWS